MDIRLDYGPWETIFLGQTYGHEVEIVSNPEHFFLVFVYDVQDGRKIGAVVEGYKAFAAKGLMEAFVQTLPKPSFGVEKTLGETTNKLFFLSFDPFYVDFRAEDFSRRIDTMLKRTDESSATIIDLARASALDLKDLSTVAKTEYATILGDPFTIKLMASGQRQNMLSKLDLASGISPQEKQAVIQLGLSKTREIVKEQSEYLKRTLIVGQGPGVLYTSYILAENLLLENTPVLIVDSNDYFDSLASATKETFALKDALVEYEPMGFPIKQLTAKEHIHVSLKDADLYFLLDLLGMKDAEFSKNLSLFCFTVRANTPQELIAKVSETKELSEYEKLRAERVLMILDMHMQGLFGEALPAEELTKSISGKLGRATLVKTKNLTKEEKIVFMHTLMRQLTRSYTETQLANCVLFLPDSPLLFNQSEDKTITALSRLENRGFGVVMASEREPAESLAQTLSAKINLVSGKDVAVSIKGKRNYRVLLRPSLSGNPKAERQ